METRHKKRVQCSNVLNTVKIDTFFTLLLFQNKGHRKHFFFILFSVLEKLPKQYLCKDLLIFVLIKTFKPYECP
jgi:hypothetical protein